MVRQCSKCKKWYPMAEIVYLGEKRYCDKCYKELIRERTAPVPEDDLDEERDDR